MLFAFIFSKSRPQLRGLQTFLNFCFPVSERTSLFNECLSIWFGKNIIQTFWTLSYLWLTYQISCSRSRSQCSVPCPPNINRQNNDLIPKLISSRALLFLWIVLARWKLNLMQKCICSDETGWMLLVWDPFWFYSYNHDH